MIPARLRPRAPRNAEFVSLLESFLIAAVTTVLVIRTQLWLTHYPQLGGGGLHIAHLLYGGIFMAIAIGVLLMYLGARPAAPGRAARRRRLRLLHRRARQVRHRGQQLLLQARRRRDLPRLHRDLPDHPRPPRGATCRRGARRERDLPRDRRRARATARARRERAVELLQGADTSRPVLAAMRNLLTELNGLPSPPPRWYERWAARLRASTCGRRTGRASARC